MSEKQYPLHHDHGTVTISRDVFESMTAELERLRPMECGLELAEADKHIGELKKEIAELKKGAKNLILDNYLKDKEIQRLENLCESYRIDCDNIAIREANAYKEIERADKKLRRQKYKRCLAMAWWCSAELGMLVSTWEFKIKHYKKWHKRWLELAEQFKEKK